MEAITEHSGLQIWLLHYGSIALFVLLTLGILALPIPEETLMVIAGALMKNGDLYIPQTIIAAFLGSLCGISISYVLGRTAGHYLILRYGKWVGITEEHVERAHNWFEHYGKWTLFFGYFIPGVRHFTGFTAGTTSLEYKDFACFAYCGAMLWVATFLSIGYFFGDYWFQLFEKIELNIENVMTVLIPIVIIYLIYHFKFKKS